MKKSVLVIVLFAFFISCSTEQTNNAQKIKNDRSELNLKGNVKSLREIYYTVIDKLGEIQKENKQGESYTLFNNKGNMIEQNSYNRNNRKFIFKYDDKGNKIEWKMYKKDRLQVNETIKFKKFDSVDNWIESIVFEDDKPRLITEREIEYY